MNQLRKLFGSAFGGDALSDIVGAINAIFITYTVRTTYGAAKNEKDRLIMQQEKIDKLSPKKEYHKCLF